MTYHIIANPVAGKNKTINRLKLVESVFQSRKVEYQTHLSKGEHDATNIARELTRAGEKEIIALGGDGTLHEVLNGLENPELSLNEITKELNGEFSKSAIDRRLKKLVMIAEEIKITAGR